VRVVDGKLLGLNILYLSFVSLMPFSSALAGEYSRMLFSQIVYSGNMTLLAIGGLLNNRYVFRHPELWSEPVTVGFYRGSIFRTAGLIVVAITAVGIAMVIPGAGNAAFLLMVPISIVSKRIEQRALQPLPRKAST
jgi:TMEM175 potassium channel family protein